MKSANDCKLMKLSKSSNVSRPHYFNQLEAMTYRVNGSWCQLTHGGLMGDGLVVGGPKACGFGDLNQNLQSNAAINQWINQTINQLIN